MDVKKFFRHMLLIVTSSLIAHTFLVFFAWVFSFGATFNDFANIWRLALLYPFMVVLIFLVVSGILTFRNIKLKAGWTKYVVIIILAFLLEMVLLIISDFM